MTTVMTQQSLNMLANQLSAGFRVYQAIMSNEIASKKPEDSKIVLEVLGEMHDRLKTFWDLSFNDSIAMGYRLQTDKLSDDFVQAAVGKFSDVMASQINEVSDRAFKEGYNAALNKGWDRAVAWDKISDAWGLDPSQMRSWVAYYPEDGYSPDKHPDKSVKQLSDMLSDRSMKIGDHESRTIVNMGRQAEWTQTLPSNARKVFRTAEDELVCPECGALDGIETDINEDFNGFFMPPLHINCRCDVELVYEGVGKSAAYQVAPEEAKPWEEPEEISYARPSLKYSDWGNALAKPAIGQAAPAVEAAPEAQKKTDAKVLEKPASPSTNKSPKKKTKAKSIPSWVYEPVPSSQRARTAGAGEVKGAHNQSARTAGAGEVKGAHNKPQAPARSSTSSAGAVKRAPSQISKPRREAYNPLYMPFHDGFGAAGYNYRRARKVLYVPSDSVWAKPPAKLVRPSQQKSRTAASQHKTSQQ